MTKSRFCEVPDQGDQILICCEAASRNMENINQPDSPIGRLPEEVLLEIMKYLNPDDLKEAVLLCQK